MTSTTFDYEQYRDVLAAPFADYLTHEPHASRVWHYSANVFTGWLHTDEYMLELSRGQDDPGTSDEIRARRLEVRQARRRLLDTADELRFVIAEPAFWRQATPDYPSPAVMRDQIERLRQGGEAANVTVQVLPMERSLLRGAMAQFTVLSFPDQDSLVYREGCDTESLSFDPQRVEKYEEHFQELVAASISLESYLAAAGERRAPSWLGEGGPTKG
jgi:Domain of unknown function (DUF5753)